MKYFNEKGELISAESADLEKGFLVPFAAVKEDAVPIDNVTKFAWDDEDYEDAMMYVLNPEPPEPTQAERIAELEEALALLLSGVTE